MTTLMQASHLPDKTRRLLAEVRAAVCACLPTADVLLYGSVARGENGPESDYDILVLADTVLTVPEQEIVRDRLFDIELREGPVFSALFYSKGEWDAAERWSTPFLRAVARDAIRL